MMNHTIRRALTVTATAGLTAGIFMGVPTAAGAATCPAREATKAQVAALVDQLRADVPSMDARQALRAALLEAAKTARGAQADTPAERAALGKQVSALARTLSDAETAVERKAIVAQIVSLRQQRQGAGRTAEEKATLKAAVDALRTAVVRTLDTTEERRAVTSQFRAINHAVSCD